jgi:hypothetical protein
MGIEPTIFGKHFWGTMHLAALGSPQKFEASHVTAYSTFYKQIPNVIPCQSCGTHLSEIYQLLPIEPALSGSQALFEWTVGVHNAVNRRLGKSEVSIDDARTFWMNGSSGVNPIMDCVKNNNCSKVVYIALLIAILFMMSGGMYLAFANRSSFYSKRK